MKSFLIIPIHSIADVITNSSSELFVCNTEKTEKEIREILEFFHGAGIGTIRVLQGYSGFKEILDELMDYYRGSYFESLLSLFISEDILLRCDRIPSISQLNYDEKVNAWMEKYKDLLEEKVPTITIMESSGDNSVSWEAQEFIQQRFHALRYHLG